MPPASPEPLSARNPGLRRLRALARDPGARRDESAYLIEGFTLVREALVAGVELETVYFEPSAADHELLVTAAESGVALQPVVAGGLRGVVDAVTPQGVAAIARKPDAASSGIPADAEFVVVLVGIADPGNAGTILRTAAASGADAVVLTAGSVDAYAPKCVRASAGAIFRLPVTVGVDAHECLAGLGRAGYMRVATVVDGGVAYDSLDLGGRLALVLGNEAAGLDVDGRSGLGALIDRLATVPMASGVESLNVAMAAAVMCFEVRRQRRATDRGESDLPSFDADGTVRRP